MDQIEAVDALRAWVDRQHIDGVAIVSDCVRDQAPCLYVYVTSPEAAQHLPETFEGFEVIVEQGDPVQAQPGGPAEPER